MRFLDRCPSTWKELQDYVALLLNQAGYHAISPCTIETVRGKVEVDVLVESPDPMVKRIICECKFWKTLVSKEKVHAFRSVVHDSGASLGLLISKAGFQSGAFDAAKLSNVKLLTWEEFLTLISGKWVIEMLKRIKKRSDPIAEYVNPHHFPFEELNKEDIGRYLTARAKYTDLRRTCWLLHKTDLFNDSHILKTFYSIDGFSAIVEYLEFLDKEIDNALKEFKDIINNSGITIRKDRFEKLESFSLFHLE